MIHWALSCYVSYMIHTIIICVLPQLYQNIIKKYMLTLNLFLIHNYIEQQYDICDQKHRKILIKSRMS